MRNFIAPLLFAILFVVTPSLTSAVAAENASLVGDADKGKRVFVRCKACHSVAEDGRHGLGPNLHDLFGRKAGAAKDYGYSKAFEDSDVIWNEETLDRWLESPAKFIPGNKMPFPGMRKAQERADVIAFMKRVTAE